MVSPSSADRTEIAGVRGVRPSRSVERSRSARGRGCGRDGRAVRRPPGDGNLGHRAL